MGMGLLALSLVCDGFTGPMQEKVFSGSNRPPALAMMMYSNLYASLFCLAAIVATGQLMPAVSFCTRFPAIMIDIVGFALLSAVGQNFIYLMVSNFDSLVCSITTTTRKFFTILLSVIWFGHSLTQRQWGGVALVFLGLGLDIIIGYLNKPKQVDVGKTKKN